MALLGFPKLLLDVGVKSMVFVDRFGDGFAHRQPLPVAVWGSFARLFAFLNAKIESIRCYAKCQNTYQTNNNFKKHK